MDLLGGYDSGSDSNEDFKVDNSKHSSSSSSSSTTAATTAATAHVSSSVSAGKKVKKLDISVLPAAIQIALQRGDDADDSDDDYDDDMEIYHGEVKSKSSKNASSNDSNSYNKLLSQLPQPVKVGVGQGKGSVGKSVKSANPDADKNSVPAAAKIEITIDTRVHNTTMPEEESGHHSLFTFAPTSSTNTNPSSGHQTMHLPTTTAPVSTRPVRNDASNNEFSNSMYNVANIKQQQHTLSSSNDTYNEGLGEVNMASSSKRKREIEQQLMNGNISVVENSASQLFDVSGGNVDWAQEKYMDKKAIEKQILSQYHVNDGTMKQITAVNGRRHQINSLVANAAKTELQLLEKGGGGHRKADTRAKYGW